MTPEELIAALGTRRVLLSQEGGTLKYRAPGGALDDDLRAALKQHKESLLASLGQRPGYVLLSPLSYNQLSLYFLHVFEPGSTAYNLALAIRFRSPVDGRLLEEAIRRLVRRHEQLRTTYGTVDFGVTAVPCQFVEEDLWPALERRDASAWTEAELGERVRAFYATPISLGCGPVVRAALFEQDAARGAVLVLLFHHIAADAWSLSRMARDLGENYRNLARGDGATPAAVPEPYTAYAFEQRAWVVATEGQRQIQFWKDQHTPPAAPLDLVNRDRRPKLRRSTGATRYFRIEPATRTALEQTARDLGMTPFALLLALFQVLLLRRSGQKEVVVGVPTLGRRDARYQETVGYFVNLVALCSRRAGSLTFREHAQRTAQEWNHALDHRDAPIAAVVEALGGTRDPSRTPLFQVLFNLLSRKTLGDAVDLLYPSAAETLIDFGGLKASPFPIDQQEGQFDLTLEFVDREDGYLGLFKYCTDLFSAAEAEAWVGEFGELLGQVTGDPARVVLGVVEPAGPTAVAAPKPEVVVVSATYTAEAMQEFFELWTERLDWSAEIAFAPFNQVFQELLDPSSALRRNRRGCGVVLVRLDDLLGRSSGADSEPPPHPAVGDRLRANLEELAQAVETAVAFLQVPLCVVVSPSSPRLIRDLPQEAEIRTSFVDRIRRLSGVITLTPEEIHRWYPVDDYDEPLGEEMGHIPYTRSYLAALATGIVRVLRALARKPVKAVVVDCDGTLWDGVAGEDGPTGVVVGPLQQRFQEFLIEQYGAGVVLCLCSKNQEADVWAVFDQHPDMRLRREHILFWRINWQPKSANLRELAAEMNLGLEALAFLDDNPIEREEVRAGCPAVLCAELPTGWDERVDYLRHLWPLDRIRVTREDRQRQEHYRAERQRDDLKRSAGSFHAFLQNLDLQIDWRPVQPADRPRVAQLSLRTNQFNATVRRLTEAELANLLDQPAWAGFVTSVRDRFGDYGLVGAALAQAKASVLRVELFLLSCRALGRGVEHRMASALGAHAEALGCATVEFPVRETDRNEPARRFLRQLVGSCRGEVGSDGTVHVSASALAGLRYEPAEVEAAQPRAATEESASTEPAAPLWLPGEVCAATEFRALEAIVEAADGRRQRLRAPRLPVREAGSPARPSTATELLIATTWQKVLGAEEIDTHASFFDLGETSILLTRVAVDLRRHHGIEVSIVDLFQYPTIAELAQHLVRERKEPAGEDRITASAQRQREALAGQRRPSAFERLRQARGA